MIAIRLADYGNSKDAARLRAALSHWFTNPKELNLTSPQSGYPFNFKQWVKKFYSIPHVLPWVATVDEWIVGHGALRIYREERRGHIFHLIIDRQWRGQGIGRRLITAVESAGRKRGLEHFTLYVNPANDAAIKLYSKLGYQPVDTRRKNTLKMEKRLPPTP